MANVIGPHWPGFDKIKSLIIFGDSYSDVGYPGWCLKNQHPSRENPLGVEFPGVTFAEPDQPNWVGYLITEFSPNPSMVVYDYAVGGDRMDGVRRQVERLFIPHAGQKPDWAPWTSSDTLFITWVGINDCAYCDDDEALRSNQTHLFETQAKLYDLGARNFLFIDVPPIDRSPALAGRSTLGHITIYNDWNSILRETAAQFAANRPDITVMIFSSHATFTRVLDDPVKYGFKARDASRARGTIWIDHLHPTSKVHLEVARDVGAFLNAQPAYVKQESKHQDLIQVQSAANEVSVAEASS